MGVLFHAVKKKLKVQILFLLVLTLFPLISAVTLDSGTVLNTSISNSSMTFTSSIEVDLVTIRSINVTLDNITCSDGGFSSINNLFWNTTNSNLDSVYFCGAFSFLKLNENSGIIAYDVSAQSNNGTITGATWNNDGVDNTLTEDIDYTRTGTIFTIINSEFAWSQILVNYAYLTNELNATTSDILTSLSGATDWFPIVIVITFMVVLITLTVMIIRAIRGSGLMVGGGA